MDNEEQVKRIEAFINDFLLIELEKVQTADLKVMQFILMGQTIEVLGSILDNKPMKARGQSAFRFSKAINYLFGGRYRLLNDNLFLYDKLRNQMVHTFIPSKDLILLTSNKDDKYRHLEYFDDKLVLISDIFYEDIKKACHLLLKRIKQGKVKSKNIAFEN